MSREVGAGGRFNIFLDSGSGIVKHEMGASFCFWFNQKSSCISSFCKLFVGVQLACVSYMFQLHAYSRHVSYKKRLCSAHLHLLHLQCDRY